MRDRVSLYLPASLSARRVQHASERGRHIYYCCCSCCCCCCVYNIGIAYNGRTYNVIHNPQAISRTRTHTLTHTQQEAHNERRHRTTLYRSFAAIKESNSEWESVLNLTYTLTHKQAYKYFMCKHCINISVRWYCFYSTPSLTHVLPLCLPQLLSVE